MPKILRCEGGNTHIQIFLLQLTLKSVKLKSILNLTVKKTRAILYIWIMMINYRLQVLY
jgi:hypothetical protein